MLKTSLLLGASSLPLGAGAVTLAQGRSVIGPDTLVPLGLVVSGLVSTAILVFRIARDRASVEQRLSLLERELPRLRQNPKHKRNPR